MLTCYEFVIFVIFGIFRVLVHGAHRKPGEKYYMTSSRSAGVINSGKFQATILVNNGNIQIGPKAKG